MGPFRITQCDFTNTKEELTIPWHNLTNRNVIIAFYFNDVEMLVWQDILALGSSIFTSRDADMTILNNCIFDVL